MQCSILRSNWSRGHEWSRLTSSGSRRSWDTFRSSCRESRVRAYRWDVCVYVLIVFYNGISRPLCVKTMSLSCYINNAVTITVAWLDVFPSRQMLLQQQGGTTNVQLPQVGYCDLVTLWHVVWTSDSTGHMCTRVWLNFTIAGLFFLVEMFGMSQRNDSRTRRVCCLSLIMLLILQSDF